MKLIMESWNRFLTEEELKSQITAYLDENNIILTEAELEEAMPKWLQKLGSGAALAATLAGAGAPSTAYATTPVSDADAPTQVVENPADDYNAALGFISSYIQSKPVSERGDLEMELMRVQGALDAAADGDLAALDSLEGADSRNLETIMGQVSDLKTSDADGVELYNTYKIQGAQIDIS